MFSRLLEVARDRAGAAMLEFAIVLPLLLIVLFGIVQFGIYFYQYVSVQYAAQIGERTFLANRPLVNESYTPYASTVTAIQTATSLQSNKLKTTLSVNGTTCTSDASCGAALTTAYSAISPQTASVEVSYPCLTLLSVGWIPGNFCPGGVLTSTITQRVD